MSQAKLCQAVEEQWRVSFLYRGKRWSVDPYIVYEDVETGEILLGAITAARQRDLVPFTVADIAGVRLERQFKPIIVDTGDLAYEKAICVLEFGKICE